MRFGHPLRPEWPLDPEVTYLNHGTVGATPHAVLRTQQALRDEMARQPSRFLLREVSHSVGTPAEGPTRIRQAAREVAPFLGARGDDVVFVDNATSGANTVVRSFPLQAGDEILTTNHTYGAVMNATKWIAARRGAIVRTIDVPYPTFDADDMAARVERALGPKTRLLVIDHITSGSAIVMPIAAIAARCRARGVAVLVDGAHAPGAIPLDIPSLGVDYYVGNLHKWGQAPQSSAVLWVLESRQAALHPLVISWDVGQGFTAEFDMVGTRDPTPWLASPAGFRFLADLSLDDVFRWNHALAWEAGRLLASRWGTNVGVPESHVGTMMTVAAPDRFGSDAATANRLRDTLLETHGIEVHVHAGFGRTWVRVSTQVYNEIADVERLADVVMHM
ncbi:MAG TPA: aminotransferase class V-fold PLP-dependent enzyme [Vicinamibacterales bacterium]|nr:aminotransferase class V-fold PLP-dependent enzyme [Vicinamibacterales bacterium]